MVIAHNIIMTVVYIIFSVIVLILIMPLKVRIIRDDSLQNDTKDNNIDVYIVKFFNVRIDLDKIISMLFFDNNESNKITFKTIYESSKKIKKNKNFIKTLFKFIIVRKLTITYDVSNVASGVLAWNSIYYLRNKFISLFLNIDNEYYNVNYVTDKKNNVNLEIVFYIRLIYVLYSYLANIKETKIIKRNGSVENV